MILLELDSAGALNSVCFSHFVSLAQWHSILTMQMTHFSVLHCEPDTTLRSFALCFLRDASKTPMSRYDCCPGFTVRAQRGCAHLPNIALLRMQTQQCGSHPHNVQPSPMPGGHCGSTEGRGPMPALARGRGHMHRENSIQFQV